MKKLLILVAIFSLSLSNKIALSDGHVETVWETEKIFELPESVIYDPTNDVLYVSNITDHPFNKDGTGYISKIGLDGTVIEKKWIDKLVEDPNEDGSSYAPYMNGNFVFKNAVVRFMEVINEALIKNNLTKEDINLLIPHQANLRINQFVQKQLSLPDEKVYNNIMKYGNTTAASIPIALAEAIEKGKLNDGDILCLAAFGAGFTWGSALIRW